MGDTQRKTNRDSDFIQSLSSYSQQHLALHWSGNFAEFMADVVPASPRGVARVSHEHVWDMICWYRDNASGDDQETSYTAKLFNGGVEEISRKIGEEATEVIVAALRETPAHVVSESADLIYHLMVLWAEQDITPDDVFEELEGRTGISGIEEKNSRDQE